MTDLQQGALLEVRDLSLGFGANLSVPPVLDRVNLALHENETVVLLGESGCGKSVAAMSIMRLLRTPPAQYLGGSIRFRDTEMLTADERTLRSIRGNKMSMIFQEPMTSLNPVLTVEDQVGEVLRLHSGLNKTQIRQRIIDLLDQVRIPSAEKRLRNYPFQFSGGMRQRIMIAMAMACDPDILIADEPTTALDVTIQAQIIRLLKEMQEKKRMTVLLITHDLGVVAEFAQRTVVMYAGQVVETAKVRDLFKHPSHPYTIGLLQSLPSVKGETERLYTIKGSVPPAYSMPKGCRFHPRCPYAQPQCAEIEPPVQQIAPGHTIKCHLKVKP